MQLKHVLISASLLASPISLLAASESLPNDSVYLFTYANDNGSDGLKLSWSDNNTDWHIIGDKKPIDMVKSDFGPWGSHKKMFEPHVFRTANGWRCLWWCSDRRQTVACADSPDLIKWHPQRYADKAEAAKFVSDDMIAGEAKTIEILGKQHTGDVIKISRDELNKLIANAERVAKVNAENAEMMSDDLTRFANLAHVNATAKMKTGEKVAVSPDLFGIFFEDISHAADGGLYAELIQNRDFEYLPSECGTKGWGPAYGWTLTGSEGVIQPKFGNILPIHPNNPTYLQIKTEKTPVTLANGGFDGISVNAGENYVGSFFIRLSDASKRSLEIMLKDAADKTVAAKKVKVSGSGWQKIPFTLNAKKSMSGGSLQITFPKNTDCDVDMISLFPTNTYKNRTNGMRRDLAEALENLHPRFVRFPGGCVAHGEGIENIYDWKGSVGSLESRKPLRNLWGYHQTRGLGYHEYFLLCEDLGATPLPVLSAGVPCQNSSRPWKGSHNEITTLGQQCGLPQEMMPQYIQDVLDLIEYANGSVDTEWGKRRAEAGHPEPFNMRYIGIGNEDMITEVFVERFKQVYDAVQKAHPEITIVGTVGPFYEGSDYDEGWKLANELNIPIVDEHYYVEPGWMINNQDYYKDYKRNATKVYLGEYASHVPGRKNNMETALSTALYLTSVERNSDVVTMSSYAPLFAKKDHINWRPDLIYFDNDTLNITTDYHVQQMYAANQGDEYLPAEISFDTMDAAAQKRIGYSAMNVSATGEKILKLVNLLPVEVSFSQDFIANGTQASQTLLAGNPEQEDAAPVVNSITIGDSIALPPYSFMIIRTK